MKWSVLLTRRPFFFPESVIAESPHRSRHAQPSDCINVVEVLNLTARMLGGSGSSGTG